jgi:eukaryotic-like serine/threonine-protein kinase
LDKVIALRGGPAFADMREGPLTETTTVAEAAAPGQGSTSGRADRLSHEPPTGRRTPLRWTWLGAIGGAGLAAWLLGNIYLPLHLLLGAVLLRALTRKPEAPPAVVHTGTYRLSHRLGKGGMGEVYLAHHALLERRAAVKTLRSDQACSADALQRFEWEVRTASELTHPNTISIYDYGRTADGRLYYAMEYLEGLDLQRLVELHGPVPAVRVVFILDQILASLGEAHRRGILHRDVKPSNIFLTERGGELDFVKVLDFGLAQELNPRVHMLESAVARESIVGTPLYMAPEVFYGRQPVDGRSDLYSLGAVAYFLLVGEPMFESRNAAQIFHDQAKTAPAAPSELGIELSPELEAALLRLLAKDPDERFHSAEALRAALQATPEWGLWTRQEAARWWAKAAPHVPAGAERPISRSGDPEPAAAAMLRAA